MRPLVRDDAAVAPWYRHNVFLFLNGEASKRLDAYAALEAKTVILTEQALKTVTEVLG